MSNDFYNATGWPATGAAGASSPARAELTAIAAGFDKLPTITGNGSKAVVVNAGGTALTVTTGTFALAGNLATTGAFNTTFAQGATVTLTLPLVSGTLATLAGTEALTNKTYNKVTVTAPATSATLTIVDGKTVTVNKTLTLDGTDGTTMTFPATSANIGRLEATQQALSCYLLPSMNDGWRGVYRAGFDWWSRNQQWGGPFGFVGLLDGATDTLYNGEAATGFVNPSTDALTADSAARTYSAMGFKVAETQTVSAVWLKLYKVGNPANNLGVFILPDDGTGLKPTGSTPITNGTTTAQSGKLHTSDTSGQWYRFVFATPPSLTAGTQYHIVVKSSGAVDGSNYWVWKSLASKTYPFGSDSVGDATPTWSSAGLTSYANNFLVELSATAQTLQTSGQFDGKLQFGGSGASGTLTMSRGLCNQVPLHELVDTTEGTIYLVGTALTKDATFLDLGYGEDHDRIVLRSNVTTGYLQGNLYESGGTNTAVTATATDLSSGTHSIGIYWRAKNDGADRIDIFVDGTTYSSATNLSLDFDKLMGQLGTMWVGGGFALAPTYSGSSIGINGFSGLPSTLGWTWAGGAGWATEASAFSVSSGKLFQNKNGFASTDIGYYRKTTAGLSNANGWDLAVKMRVVSSTNGLNESSLSIDVEDGAERILGTEKEYYFEPRLIVGSPLIQLDCKANEITYKVSGKGTDAFAFFNRKLVMDGSGGLTSVSASNQITIGDQSANAGINADAIYSYWNYCTTAWNPPQFTSGSISEFAIWQGDMKALWPLLYNSGTFVSVKALLGVQQNYIDKSSKIPAIVQRGITSYPTTTSITYATLAELAVFVVAETIRADSKTNCYNSANDAAISTNIYVDGIGLIQDITQTNEPNATPSIMNNSTRAVRSTYLGLHKVENRWSTTAATATAAVQARSIIVEPKL